MYEAPTRRRKVEVPWMQMAFIPGLTAPQGAMDRVKAAQEKKAAAKYVPTANEIWFTGYGAKRGIFQLKNSPLDKARLEDVRKALEKGLVSRIEAGKPISKSEALALYPAVMAANRARILAEMVENMPANYACIDTIPAFKAFLPMLEKEPIFAIDTETTGLDCHGESRIVGVSFTLPIADVHVYLPLAHEKGPNLPREGTFQALRPILENPDKQKVLFNARFDAHMLYLHGVDLQGIAWDGQIAMKLLNENEPNYRLKNLANKYGHLFGYTAHSHTFDDLFGEDYRFDKLDTLPATCYAAKDTHLTWLLYKWQLGHMERVPQLLELYRKEENPLIPVVIDMERAGMYVDLEFAKVYREELKTELDVLGEELKTHFQGVNVDSPAQLSTFLYDKVGLTPPTKKRSVDAESLEILADEYDGIQLLLDYREKSKLFGTYIDVLPSLVKADGNIHGRFNQVAAKTGRFSSNDPNLQNQPYKARKLFTAPPGKLLISVDYSQIEPRVLAHMSGDKALQSIYLSGVDLYSTLAANVFKLPIGECGDGSKPRKMMKTGLLAVMYGTSMRTLAKQLHISIGEAQKMIEDFFTAYPAVGAFIAGVHREIREVEYVTMMDGRKRRFPGIKQEAAHYDACLKQVLRYLGADAIPPEGIWSKECKDKIPYNLRREFQGVKGPVERAQRQAVNARIQGSAAGILKLAMIALHRHFKAQGKDWKIIATVHDEVILLVDETITDAEKGEVCDIMTGVVKLDVPLKVDMEAFNRWGG